MKRIDYEAYKILVLEPEHHMKDLIVRILSNEGISTVGALNIDELKANLENVEDKKVLLLISYDACNRELLDMINDMNENGKKIKFMIMIAAERKEEVIKLLNMGAEDYVLRDGSFFEFLSFEVKKVIKNMKLEEEINQYQNGLKDKTIDIEEVIKNMPSAIRVVDENRVIRFVNKEFESLTNTTASELKGKKCWEVMNTENCNTENCCLNKIKTNERIEQEVKTQHEEGIVCTKIMSILPLENEDKEVKAFIQSFEDVNKNLENELGQEDRLDIYKHMFSTVKDNIVFVDKDYKYIIANPHYEETIGVKKGSCVGKYLKEIIGEELFVNVKRNLDKAFSGYEMHLKEWREYKKGEKKYFQIDYYPLVKLKEIVGVVVNLRDITKNKEYEEALIKAKNSAEEASKIKTQFIFNVSHEIRTPMNGILGMIQLLDMTELSEDQKEYMDMLRDSADRMMAIVDSILDLSEVESGELKMREVEFDMREMIKKAIRFFEYQARTKGISLKYKIDRKIPDKIIGDPARISQIIVNVVGNAIKFTEEGEVNVELKLRELTKETVRIDFEVKDTGIGIPDLKVKDIFDSFTQADDSNTRKYGGAGLGLAISKKLVELMNGKIGVKSEVSVGSTFEFDLLLRYGEKSYPKENKLESKILITGDNFVDNRTVERVLEKKGCIPVSAYSGKDALEIARVEKFDLMIVDGESEYFGGLKTISEIRRIDKKNRTHTPVVILGEKTHKRNDLIMESTEYYADGYISKPVREEELNNLIDSLIKSKLD